MDVIEGVLAGLGHAERRGIAVDAEVKRDEVGLSARDHRHGRRTVAEMAAEPATIADLFPEVRTARFTHAWGGPLGIARDWWASVGLDRTILMLLCEAYREEEVDGDERVVMKFHPKVAPIILRLMAIAFFALAAYVGFESGRALVQGRDPDPSPLGIGIAVASIIIMPALSWAQRRTGRRLAIFRGFTGGVLLRGAGVRTSSGAPDLAASFHASDRRLPGAAPLAHLRDGKR